MRHRHDGFKLSRDHEHRMAMFRNMSMALIRHEEIITTVAKAKALRPFFDRGQSRPVFLRGRIRRTTSWLSLLGKPVHALVR